MQHVVVFTREGGPPAVYGPFPDEELARRWATMADDGDRLAGRLWPVPVEEPDPNDPDVR